MKTKTPILKKISVPPSTPLHVWADVVGDAQDLLFMGGYDLRLIQKPTTMSIIGFETRERAYAGTNAKWTTWDATMGPEDLAFMVAMLLGL